MPNIIRVGNGSSAELTDNANVADVLSEKTFYSNNEDNKLTGTMPNNGAISASVGANSSYTIPKGYHNGSGRVTGPTLNGNASSGDVLSGRTFYSNNGTIQSGSMSDRGNWGTTINPGGSVTIPQGYHNGSGRVSANNVPKGGFVWSGSGKQTSSVLDSGGNTINYILFSCYDGAGYEVYLEWSDNSSNWYEHTHSSGGSGQYVGSIKQGTASGHRYWRLRTGNQMNSWARGGAIFIQ